MSARRLSPPPAMRHSLACRLALLFVAIGLPAAPRGDRVLREEGPAGAGEALLLVPRAEAKKVKGELRLDTRDGVLQGRRDRPGGRARRPGEEPAHPGRAARRRDLQMPPREKLPAAEIADLEAWVKMGAPDPRAGGAATTSGSTSSGRASSGRSSRSRDRAIPAVRTQLAADPVDRVHPREAGGEGAHAGAAGRQADADPPGDLRPHRPAADARGDRRVPRRTTRRRRSRRWSIGCSRRRPTASGGAGTGSTWSATPTPPGTTPTTRSRRCTGTATG